MLCYALGGFVTGRDGGGGVGFIDYRKRVLSSIIYFIGTTIHTYFTYILNLGSIVSFLRHFLWGIILYIHIYLQSILLALSNLVRRVPPE